MQQDRPQISNKDIMKITMDHHHDKLDITNYQSKTKVDKGKLSSKEIRNILSMKKNNSPNHVINTKFAISLEND
jgi:hypothetical protein